MNELERLIKQSLDEAGHSYEPRDEIAARDRFIRLRRRRRTYWFAGTAAATAMAVAVALFVVPGPANDGDEAPIQVAARPLAVVETIEVGGAPASVASDGEAVWVSNTAGDGVVRIDPETNEFENVFAREGQTPDELAVTPKLWGDDAFPDTANNDEAILPARVLWVTTEEGVLAQLNGRTGEILGDAELSSGGSVFADIATDADGLWVVFPDEGGVTRFEDLPDGRDGLGLVDVLQIGGPQLTDIAWDGVPYGLDGDGHLLRVTDDRALQGVVDEPLVSGGMGRNADLAAGLGYVWVSSGDDSDLRVFRIDPSGEDDVLEIPLEGRYADLTVADGRLWVLAGGGDSSLLYRLSPDGAILGEPLALPPGTNDVAVGAGSAWVPNTADGTVLRISEAPDDDDSDPAPTEPDDGAQSSAQPFFAYSANGDIYVELTDGSTKQITMTPDEELNPTFLVDESLVFERHDHETDWWGLVRHDLVTGEESSVPLPEGWEGGAHPAVSAAGDLAWIEPTESGGVIRVWPTYFTAQEAGSNDAVEVPLPEDLSDPRGLVFSDDAKVLYYQAIGEGWVTVQLPWLEGEPPTPFVLNGVNDQPRGTTYVQPADASDEGITVLDVCCRETEGDPYSQFRIAQILFTEGGATHQSVTGPADLPDADPGELGMISLHGAVLNEDGSWDLFAEDGGSWFVTDGANLWLLTRDGGGQLAPETLEAGELSGLSVNPVLVVAEEDV